VRDEGFPERAKRIRNSRSHSKAWLHPGTELFRSLLPAIMEQNERGEIEVPLLLPKRDAI